MFIAYKLVIRDNGLLSIFHRGLKHRYGRILKYEINEWTYPTIKGSKLFVFDTIENAMEFLHTNMNLKYQFSTFSIFDRGTIWMCEVHNPSKNGIVADSLRNNWQTVIKAWKLRKYKKRFKHLVHLIRPPNGTLFVDAVKLIKEVYSAKPYNK